MSEITISGGPCASLHLARRAVRMHCLAHSSANNRNADQRESETAAIRSARTAQNRAIAAGDTAEAARYWTDDVEIRRGLGPLVVGRAAYQRLIVPDSAARLAGTDLIYERTPSSVEVSTRWPLAYESGNWVGHLGSANGPVVIRGRYGAQWVKQETRWLIRGEVYVALSCAGVGCSYEAMPATAAAPVVR